MANRLLKKFLPYLVGALVITLGISIFTATTATSRFYYAVTALGTLGGSASYARGINDAGQVVGSSALNSSEARAFLWNNGQMTGLATLRQKNTVGRGALGINDQGQVVGSSDVGESSISVSRSRAVLWQNDTITNLGTLGGKNSYAFDINNQGQVVGSSQTSSGLTHAFLWENGTMKDLGTLGGYNSAAYSINNKGQIVGYKEFSTGFPTQHAFLEQNGITTDLGTLDGRESFAYDINDRGQVVGISSLNNPGDGVGGEHCVLWSNGKITDLSPRLANLSISNCSAKSINNRGTVVGSVEIKQQSFLFVWKNGKTYNLNRLLPPNSGWVLKEATAINNSGQIVGYGSHNGQDRAFLLTPTRITQ